MLFNQCNEIVNKAVSSNSKLQRSEITRCRDLVKSEIKGKKLVDTALNNLLPKVIRLKKTDISWLICGQPWPIGASLMECFLKLLKTCLHGFSDALIRNLTCISLCIHYSVPNLNSNMGSELENFSKKVLIGFRSHRFDFDIHFGLGLIVKNEPWILRS